MIRMLAIAAYVGSVVAANWLTATYAMVPVGFGLTATAGTVAAGFAFVARDAVQDSAGRSVALLALAMGCAVSWFVATPALAAASAAAFACSELVDMTAYTPLRKHGYVRAALASNLAGSVVDTLLFLWLAGFGLAAAVVAGQLLGKAWVTVVVVGLVVIARAGALLRHRVRAESA